MQHQQKTQTPYKNGGNVHNLFPKIEAVISGVIILRLNELWIRIRMIYCILFNH